MHGTFYKFEWNLVVILHFHCHLGKYASILANVLNTINLLIMCNGVV
jgi:hypothetical protein